MKKYIIIDEIDNPRYEMARALVELGYRYHIPAEEIVAAFPSDDFQSEVKKIHDEYGEYIKREKCNNASLDQEDPKPTLPRMFRRSRLNGGA